MDNLKHLVPTYRARFRFVQQTLAHIADGTKLGRVLDLGCGEGDFDHMILNYCRRLDACDLNRQDIEGAKRRNRHLKGVRFRVQDAHALDYGDEVFDAVICAEVLEHVENPARLVAEVSRVLRPGGVAIFTCPHQKFPFMYDPINYILQFSRKSVPIGAYAYGHTFLVTGLQLETWLENERLGVLTAEPVIHGLSALAEAYWAGWLQKMFKSNRANTGRGGRRGISSLNVREPRLARVTDLLNRLDARLSPRKDRSVFLGYVAKKRGVGDETARTTLPS